MMRAECKHVWSELRETIAGLADASRAASQMAYMKGQAQCLGVPLPAVDAAIKQYHFRGKDFLVSDAIQVLSHGLAMPYFEEKELGIRLAAKILQSHRKSLPIADAQSVLDALHQATLDRHIMCWPVADSVASKVLRAGLLDSAEDVQAHTQHVLDTWISALPATAPGYDGITYEQWCWLVRLAFVAQLSLARQGKRTEQLLKWADTALSTVHTQPSSDDMSTRFVHLGIGWALREATVLHQDAVASWLLAAQAEAVFTTEGVRYATEKMPRELIMSIRQARKSKSAVRGGRSKSQRSSGRI